MKKLVLIVGFLFCVLVSCGVGVAIGSSGGDSSTPSAGKAINKPTDEPTAEDTSVEEPTEDPTPTEEATPKTPRKGDFAIKVKTRSKQCFGTAGCNITFQIKPVYLGSVDLDTETYDITYVVTGGEDGPQINTFTIDHGTASYDEEEFLSTSNSGVKLTAKVTSVDKQGL